MLWLCVYLFLFLCLSRKWEVGIPGKEDTDWAGGVYKLTVQFPEDYPAKVSFSCPCFIFIIIIFSKISLQNAHLHQSCFIRMYILAVMFV
jgi:hypothetical protein